MQGIVEIEVLHKAIISQCQSMSDDIVLLSHTIKPPVYTLHCDARAAVL